MRFFDFILRIFARYADAAELPLGVFLHYNWQTKIKELYIL